MTMTANYHVKNDLSRAEQTNDKSGIIVNFWLLIINYL